MSRRIFGWHTGYERSGTHDKGMPWYLLVRLFGLLALLAFVYQLSGPLAPFWAEELHFSLVEIGLISSAQYLGAGLFALPGGLLVDKLTPNRIGMASLFGLGVAVLIGSRLTSAIGIAAVFFLIGSLRAPLMSLCNVLVFRFVPAKSLNSALAIQTMGIPVGAAIASIAIPWLVVRSGSLETPLALVGLTLLIVGVWFPHLRLAARNSERTLISSSTGASSGGKRIPQFGIGRLMTATVGLTIAESTVMTYFLIYLVEVLNLGVVEAGVYFSVVRLAGAAFRIPIARLADAVGPRLVVVPLAVVGAVGALSLYMLSGLPIGVSPQAILLISIGTGAGCLGWVSLVHGISVQIGGPSHAGRSNGLINTIMRFTAVASPPLFAYFATLSVGYGGALRVVTMLLATSILVVAVWDRLVGRAR